MIYAMVLKSDGNLEHLKHVLREAAKKVFSGPATKALPPPPLSSQ